MPDASRPGTCRAGRGELRARRGPAARTCRATVPPHRYSVAGHRPRSRAGRYPAGQSSGPGRPVRTSRQFCHRENPDPDTDDFPPCLFGRTACTTRPGRTGTRGGSRPGCRRPRDIPHKGCRAVGRPQPHRPSRQSWTAPCPAAEHICGTPPGRPRRPPAPVCGARPPAGAGPARGPRVDFPAGGGASGEGPPGTSCAAPGGQAGVVPSGATEGAAPGGAPRGARSLLEQARPGG